MFNRIPTHRHPACDAPTRDSLTNHCAFLRLKSFSASFMLLLGASLAGTAQADHVTPILFDGPSSEQNCESTTPPGTDLDFTFVYKIDADNVGGAIVDGTYPIEIGNTGESFDFIVSSSDGTTFDWQSELPIGAVLTKANTQAYIYVYDPPEAAISDTGVTTPTGQAISHFCVYFDLRLTLSKTVDPAFDRNWDWQIQKSANPIRHELFFGDDAESGYNVALTPSSSDINHRVSGSVSVLNDTPFAARMMDITDTLNGVIDVALVDCELDSVAIGDEVDFQYPMNLAAGSEISCSYAQGGVGNGPGSNQLAVEMNPASGFEDHSITVPYSFSPGDLDQVFNGTVTVDDTLAPAAPWTVSAGDEDVDGDIDIDYALSFACDDDGTQPFSGSDRTVDNTASIREIDNREDMASVTINCHDLTVTKTETSSFDRDWAWQLAKTSNVPAESLPLDMMEGQSYVVGYTVSLTPTSTDSNFAVSGSITVVNNHPSRVAELTAVTDMLEGLGAVAVNCPAMTVAVSGSLICTYSTVVPDALMRTNTATATLQNYSFPLTPPPVATGTTDYSGSVEVIFAETDLGIETDECVDISDSLVDPLPDSMFCRGDDPLSVQYSYTIGPIAVDDDCAFDVTNIASFLANNSGVAGSDEVIISVRRSDCLAGCTLTPGYWKTHNETFRGGAPADDTWMLIPPAAEESVFFPIAEGPNDPLQGATWFDVMWTAPAGNPYYNLSFHYTAAVLNLLNGASAPDQVLDAVSESSHLFSEFTAEQVYCAVKASRGNGKGRGRNKEPDACESVDIAGIDPDRWIELAGILGQYNEGIIGPGHCDEDDTSAN